MNPVKWSIWSSHLPICTDLECELFRNPLDFIDLMVVHVALDVNGGRRLVVSWD